MNILLTVDNNDMQLIQYFHITTLFLHQMTYGYFCNPEYCNCGYHTFKFDNQLSQYPITPINQITPITPLTPLTPQIKICCVKGCTYCKPGKTHYYPKKQKGI